MRVGAASGGSRADRALRAQSGRLGGGRGRGTRSSGGIRRDELRPSVTPARQERFATQTYLAREGATGAQVEAGLQRFDEILELIRAGTALADAPGWVEGHGIPAGVEGLEVPIFPSEPDLWDFMAKIADYDPRPALERIRVPVLALFGAEDTIVPVEESVEVYREAVRPDLLTVAVLAGGGHRMQTGDPPRLVDGYLGTLSAFVAEAVA